ncbi:MAG TPA: hypothetical protein VGH10_04505, partial [Actinomycetota bacterium]
MAASRNRIVVAALLAFVLVAAAACGPSSGPTTSPSGSGATGSPSTSPSPPSCAARTLAAMSEAQRVGQLFLLGLADNQLGPEELSAIQQQHIGSVWFTQTTT